MERLYNVLIHGCTQAYRAQSLQGVSWELWFKKCIIFNQTLHSPETRAFCKYSLLLACSNLVAYLDGQNWGLALVDATSSRSHTTVVASRWWRKQDSGLSSPRVTFIRVQEGIHICGSPELQWWNLAVQYLTRWCICFRCSTMQWDQAFLWWYLFLGHLCS